jgi:hypothetical protein
MISLRGMRRPILSNHGGPVQAGFFRLWIAATICWLVYVAVVSSASRMLLALSSSR